MTQSQSRWAWIFLRSQQKWGQVHFLEAVISVPALLRSLFLGESFRACVCISHRENHDIANCVVKIDIRFGLNQSPFVFFCKLSFMRFADLSCFWRHPTSYFPITRSTHFSFIFFFFPRSVTVIVKVCRPFLCCRPKILSSDICWEQWGTTPLRLLGLLAQLSESKYKSRFVEITT
jgi:hypothetical protein